MPATTLAQSEEIAGWPESSSQRWRVIVAVSIGNALEWFDFVVYAYFAVIIAQLFFPSGNPTASLLLTLATFGATFVTRPLGAIVLGRYADRHGRKAALQVSILLMMTGSLLIAVVPVYATIGLFAPAIMVLARLVQGFSVGGEFGSATALFVEQNAKERSYFSSWQFASQGLAAILATGFGAVITALLSAEQLSDWGWRIPFFFGVLIGPVGYYIRRHIAESPEFRALSSPPVSLWRFVVDSRGALLTTLGLVILGTVAVYTILFLPTYAMRHLSLPMPNAYAAGLITGTLQLVLIPMFGALSDRIGRTPVPILAALVMLFAIYPAFGWLAFEPTIFKLFLTQALFGVVTAAYLGSMPALMSDLFPTTMRGMGLSVSYAFGVAIFGGFAPFIHEWMIRATADVLAPSYYLAFAAIVGLAALLAARRLGHR